MNFDVKSNFVNWLLALFVTITFGACIIVTANFHILNFTFGIFTGILLSWGSFIWYFWINEKIEKRKVDG